MSNVIEFKILSKDEFSRGLDRARASLNDFVKKGALLGTAFAAAAGTAAKAIIDVGSTTENLRIRLNAMLGSVAEGNQLFQDMVTFAGNVPFAYEEIMSSATQLSGVMKGGVDEINQWMPMIADLAAVSGLSIQQTTEQVVRMYSAGAGAADLFRERGINSMLGFQAGVSYSAEETKKKLIDAFESPMSKFRGASAELATTWDGVMSMIGDKWFNIKSQIADAGLFNYFKSIAMVIDQMMGQALSNTADNATVWANHLINSTRAIMDAVGFLADMFRGLEVVWDGLNYAFARVAEGIFYGIDRMAESMRYWMNMIPGIDISPFESLQGTLNEARKRSEELGESLHNTVTQPMPSEQVDAFTEQVELNFIKLQEASAEMRNAVIDDSRQIAAQTVEQWNQHLETILEANEKELELRRTYATEFTDIYDTAMATIFNNAQTLGEMTADIIEDTFFNLSSGIGKAVADSITEGKNLGKSMQNLLKSIVNDIIAGYVKMGVERLVLSTLFGTANATELAIEGGKAVALAGANGIASFAAAPWPINLGAPAFGASMAAAAKAQLAVGKVAGALHGGMDNVPAEATYLLQRGERVLSPTQNQDLTNFINGGATGGGGGVMIENLTIQISTSAASFDAIDNEDLTEFVAGRIIPTLDNLDNSGIRQQAFERS